MAKILVIDDYPPILEILRMLLLVEGHEVSTAANGPEGLRLAENTPFDLALIDVDMPGLDGIAVCQSLKGNPSTRNMLVLMMTGRPGLEVETRSRCAGAVAVLAKPFPLSAVMDEIARLAGMASRNSDGESGYESAENRKAMRAFA